MPNAVLVGDGINLSIKPGRYFAVELGAVYEDDYNVEHVVDLSGYTATAEIRAYEGAPVMATFTCVIDGPAGTVTLSMAAVTTATLERNAEFDIKLIDTLGDPIDFLEGKVILKDTITQ